MNKKYKVFVGTMYVNEGDFDNCVHAINAQKEVDITHFVVEKLPEKQAHDALFTQWNSVKHKFDLFVKIDADTVLSNETIIKDIAEFMYSDNDITGMQIPIKDFYTDSLIGGLNCFKPSVIFKTNTHELYCDRVDSGHKKEIKGDLVPKHFIPAAYHCFNSNKKQAFHFGLHRALKGQTKTYNLVKNAYKKFKDEIRLYAIEGFHSAKHFSKTGGFNYSDAKFISYFDKIEKNIEESK